MGELINALSDFMALDTRQVQSMAQRAPTRYKMYKVPKKSGGMRTIFHPARETKALQYGLMQILLQHIPVNDIAMAYRRGKKSPLKEAASAHASLNYTVSMDFAHFFPSIVPEDLLRVIADLCGGNTLGPQDVTLLRNALFLSFRGRSFLAIGAPSSPMVSNAVMRDLDAALVRTAIAVSDDAVLTRYADDISFSTDRKGCSAEFVQQVTELLEVTESPRLVLNESKTKYASRGSSRHILGLTITPEGKVSIGRDKKREIRSLLHRYELGSIDSARKQYLRGYLSYCADVEPEFVNNVILKYGADLIERLHDPTKK